jgi:tetratricopeptide (TPR) repeat protein/tRNA A-37 threonylcarbamoyl transferase component Bud32
VITRLQSRYQLLERIGGGGMGDVYRARDDHLGRDVAIKILRAGSLDDATARSRLQREAHALSKLNHPHIATVFDFGSDAGVDFIVMELVEGDNLKDLLSSDPLPQAEVVRLGRQLAEGLAAAHEQAVIHRDLKPGNLAIRPDGRLKILDFGLAQVTRPAGDLTTETVTAVRPGAGTLPYMAPEQLRCEILDGRTDVYAAGVVLYEMATGRRPFPQEDVVGVIQAILHEDPALPSSLNPGVSRHLEQVILQALDRQPDRRHQSAKELLTDLQRLERGEAPVRRRAPWSRRVILLATALGTALVATAVMVWSLLPGDRVEFGEKDWILVTDVVNETADPAFDEALREAISIDMGQSRWVRVFSDQMARNVLSYMRKPDVRRIDETLGMEICQRASIKAMLIPSIRQVGDTLQLSASFVAVPSGRRIDAVRVTARSKEQLLESGVDQLVGGVRKDLGESLASIEQTDLPIQDQTTSSWEALRENALGTIALLDLELDRARRHFERAVDLDPEFVSALTSLGLLAAHRGDREAAVKYHTAAMENLDKVSEKEQLMARAFSELQVENDARKAVETFEEILRLYPDDQFALNNLAYLYREAFGDYDAALRFGRRCLEIDPFSMVYYNNVSSSALAGGYFDEAIATCTKQLEIDPEHTWAHLNLVDALIGKRKYAEALAVLERAPGKEPMGFGPGLTEASLLRLTGNHAQSLERLQQLEGEYPDNALIAYSAAVLRTTVDGQPVDEAYERVSRLVSEQVEEPYAASWRARILARQGETAEAIRLARALAEDAEAPDFLTLGRVYALAGQAEAAVESLRRAHRSGLPHGPLLLMIDIDLDAIRTAPAFVELMDEVDRPTLPSSP